MIECEAMTRTGNESPGTAEEEPNRKREGKGESKTFQKLHFRWDFPTPPAFPAR